MNVLLPTRRLDFKAFFLFCGLGGNASGFDRVNVRVGHLEGHWRCIGAVDSDRAAVRDFQRLVRGPATCIDLFDREQFRAFHGREPGDDWREATVDDIRAAAGGERPNAVFTSPPCKGFSGLLSELRSTSEKYQALNRLTLRGIRLTLEAWADDPPEFFILENVPRIATRGRSLMDEIGRLWDRFGYSHAETTHDCGELGGLAQTRKRFLAVARHRAKVPPFLYQPPRKALRGVGEVLGGFPLPGVAAAGPMHRMRSLQMKTWIRLAFVKAGGDWRSLKDLRVVDGHLADYALVPDGAAYHNGVLGVTPWGEPTGTVTSGARPGQGTFSVADPRCHGYAEYSQYGVLPWTEPSGAVSGQSQPGGGRYAVADPRLKEDDGRHYNKYRVVDWLRAAGTIVGNAHRPGGGEQCVADPRLLDGPNGPHFNNCYRVIHWDRPTNTVTAGTSPSAGGLSVADPRPTSAWNGKGKYNVTPWDGQAGTVIAASTTGNGAIAVADPRTGDYGRGGAYGVVPWDAPAGAVTGAAAHDNGPGSVADPRLPAPDERLVAVIRSLDGTWHRPFTTLELAALQGLVEPGEAFELEGTSDSAHRERIGNAVPRYAAEAIGNVMAYTLLLVAAGETFVLSADPIWCRPCDRGLITAVAVDTPVTM